MRPGIKDWFGTPKDIGNGSKHMVKLKRARLGENYKDNMPTGKTTCTLTETPAARSPNLGNGSLSIMRTGIPFFRSDRARTRPEGPAPTYIEYQLG